MDDKELDLLHNLNEQQVRAVTYPSLSVLILAGAGSGKTKVLTTRIAWILNNNIARVNNILAVTFTNKAAAEMKKRLIELIDISITSMYLGTFHSLCNRILRQHYKEVNLSPTFQIIDSQDQLSLIKRVIKTLDVDNNIFPAKKIQHFINSNKEKGIRANILDKPYNNNQKVLADCYLEYETICNREFLVDFPELLLRSLELLQNNEMVRKYYNNKFTQVLIDEFQDTSSLQYLWLKTIANKDAAFFAVGDDDQSIYAFRGANVQNMQQFIKDFQIEKPIKLEINYRSIETILNAANAVISNNKNRLGKNLKSIKTENNKLKFIVCSNDFDETLYIVDEIKQLVNDGIKQSDIAIIYRNNAQSRIIEQTLFNANIPYKIHGGLRFYERQEIKHALAYLRLLINPDDNSSLLRIINFPTRGIGTRTLEIIDELAKQNNISLWETIKNIYTKNSKINDFIKLIENLQKSINNTNLADLIDKIIYDTNIIEYYKNTKDNNQNRIDNLYELVTAATYFKLDEYNILNLDANNLSKHQLTIASFLANAALESGELQADNNMESIQLMTIHSAKGLEFNTLFLTGLEEGIFPSKFSLEENNLEEERRLMYVAITRAKQNLYITAAEERVFHGQKHYSIISRFVDEIPDEYINKIMPNKKNNSINNFNNLKYATSKIDNIKNPLNKISFDGFFIGEKVKHEKFGVGTIIIGTLKSSGANLKINFGKNGIKELNTKIAKLTKIGT